jgi:hypothetical protein
VGVGIGELAELEGYELSRSSSARGSELRSSRLGIRFEKQELTYEASISVVWDLYAFSTIVFEISCSVRSLGLDCLSLVLWSRMEW